MKKTLTFALALLFLQTTLFVKTINAQTIRRVNLPVSKNGALLQNTFAGGMNAPQFSTADLNNDGRADLAVFDRVGEIWTTYINNGSTAQNPYVFAPEYARNLPKCSYWALLRDYNCDGIADLFTNRPAGIRVFRGYYQNNQLKFTLRNPLLLYNDPYTGFNTNIYVNQIDIPNISDMDNDGDIDIITFGADGSYVEYYKNMTLERGFGCDSLFFKMQDDCWGRFQESQLNSSITLSPNKDSCVGKDIFIGNRHPGSTILCLDNDGDQDKEAIIGDISGYHFTFLLNTRNKDTAYFTQQALTYPPQNGVSNLVFPAAYHLDTDNDGKRDLVVATNETKINENYLTWNYKNTGTDAAPNFQLSTNEFLANTMLDIGSQAVPAVFDYNNDGLLDLIVGGYGRYRVTGTIKYRSTLYLYKNIGTATLPSFELVTDDWLSLSAQNYYGLIPAIGDIDRDGDKDILLGNEDGNLVLLRNDGWGGTAYNFSTPINNWQTIDVGVASAPEIADVNQDGRNDLVIGERAGNLNYYTQNANGIFTLVTDFFGGVDGRNPNLGYPSGASVPRFFTNENGQYQLLVGTEAGNVQRYGSILGNLVGNFVKIDSAFGNIYEATNSAPLVADFNGDEINDYLVGNRRGGIALFSGANWTGVTDVTAQKETFDWAVFPNPARDALHIVVEKNAAQTQIFQMFNELGQLVKTTTTAETNFTLPINDLAEGIYFVKCGSHSVQKIVILR